MARGVWRKPGTKAEREGIRRVAQLVVHRTPNPEVGGSSPSAPASFKWVEME